MSSKRTGVTTASPRRRPEARRNRAAAEVVARPGGSAAGQPFALPDRDVPADIAALENARPWSGGPRMSASAYLPWKCFIHRRPTERA
jgi:hypothetical protein